jgi:hypothetical protein
VTSQQAEILSHVATLDVDSTPPGAQISLDHFFLGKTPLRAVRLAPGNYEVEASSADNATQAHKIALTLGEHRETFDFSTPQLIEAPSTPTASSRADAQPRTNLRPWAIGAGAFAIVGVVGAVYANGRGNAYNDFRGGPDANGHTIYCSSTDAPSSCADIKSSFTTGRTLATIGFVGAGVLATASITLFYLDASGRKNDSFADRNSPRFLRVSCGAWLGAGVTCSGAF